MIEKLMHKYALSRQGAKDLIKGVVACTLQNISFMFPVTLLYLFVKALLNGNVRNNMTFFVGGAIICLLVVFCIVDYVYLPFLIILVHYIFLNRYVLHDYVYNVYHSLYSLHDIQDDF